MDRFLSESLSGKPDNYILPFLWMHDGNTNRLKEQVQQVYRSNVRAFCVESRPHEKFGEEEWWTDMEIIMEEAARLGMKVWILDDKHFPTGYANGLIEKKYPERRKWQIIERHVDAVGPMPGASLLLPRLKEQEDVLLGAAAYPREGLGEAIKMEPIDLTGKIRGDFVYWDIPQGFWRIFYYIKTREGTLQKNYIHLIDKESVDVQIEAVYEAHYTHLKKYFGNTLVGFFSDEPSMGNDYIGRGVPTYGSYDKRPGMRALPLPWSDELYENLNQRFSSNSKISDFAGKAAFPLLAGLWYDAGPVTADIRYAYMDTVSILYRDNFSRHIGDWCRNHGVEYIGHIIEDQNAHARLGCSAGHYFRSLDGQDMSGIDIVLHEVMPGYGERIVTNSCSGGWSDPEFYHYVLAKLGSSMAHIKGSLKNRAMCEVFGAYGWAEGVPMMKWLMDHLLVRGITYFVPHAFSPDFPDPDCPPHFGVLGRDPQFEGFGKLMGYVNRVSHILNGAVHQASCAILYHADAEWMNGNDCMLTQKPAKVLYDAHLDYDILPLDIIKEDACSPTGSLVENAKLLVNQEKYHCLVAPRSPLLPEDGIAALNKLAAAGLPVYYVDAAPRGIKDPHIIPLTKLAETLKKQGMADVCVDGDFPLLRIGHWVRDKNHYFMLFNEDVIKSAKTLVHFPCSGSGLVLNLLDEISTAFEGKDLAIDLSPYESLMVVYGDDLPMPNAKSPRFSSAETLHVKWDIELCNTARQDGGFKTYKQNADLHNITGPDAVPGFSGIIRYTGEFNLAKVDGMADGIGAIGLDFGTVGETIKLKLNGKDCGLRICPPYRYDVSGIAKAGTNTLELEVANTLVQEVKDRFSFFIQIPPSGLMGPVQVLHA